MFKMSVVREAEVLCQVDRWGEYYKEPFQVLLTQLDKKWMELLIFVLDLFSDFNYNNKKVGMELKDTPF